MKAELRMAVYAPAALLLAVAAAPASAQEAAAPAPSPEEVVGPPQLRDFTLNGTVTRRAEPPPAAQAPAPSAQTGPPRSAASSELTQAAREPVRRQSEQQARVDPRTDPRPQTADAPPNPGGSPPLDLPPPTPAVQRPGGAAGEAGSLFAPQPGFEPVGDQPAGTVASTSDSGSSVLPWLVAFLFAAGTAAYYFRRQRSGYAMAGGPGLSEPASAEPRQPPQRRAPVAKPAPVTAPAPAPAPATNIPAGIVTTRLRPWLDIHFAPEGLVVDGEGAMAKFELTLFNSGSGPARDVLVEAAMFNAGPAQDQEVATFFMQPVGQGERIPLIAPLQRMTFSSVVALSRPQMRGFEMGGRSLFVPLIAFNVLYRSGSAAAQTSACYLIGIDTSGEKLAPFRLDQGPRSFNGLAARQLELGVRK